MGRLSDAVGPKIISAIDVLDVPQVVKDSIEWELVPALIPSGAPGEFGFTYMLALSLPVPGASDYVMHVAQLEDPHVSQPEFTKAVRALYASVQREADDRQLQDTSPANGGKMSPGGLALP